MRIRNGYQRQHLVSRLTATSPSLRIPSFRESMGSTSPREYPQPVIVLDQEYVKKRPWAGPKAGPWSFFHWHAVLPRDESSLPRP